MSTSGSVFSRDGITIHLADCREALASMEGGTVNTCVTSPPYWGLRDYGYDQQIGLEPTPEAYVEAIANVFREVRRVLRDDGTLWLNLGDSYFGGGYSNHEINGESWKDKMNGDKRRGRQQTLKNANPSLKPKDLVGIPWMLAFALRADGWYLRQDIIWHKPNPMPESVRDRCTKAHEYIFLLSKSARYYYNAEAIAESCSENTHARISQDVANQIGSERAHAGGKTNGKMKAVVKGSSRKIAAAGNGIKANESFQNAVCLKVEKRNKRTVWSVATQPYSGAHFAVFPPDLIEPCIMAGCPEGGVVLDPFLGSGTTAEVAQRNGCRFIGCEMNPEYFKLATKRFDQRRLF